ncbi:hypothetical protein [Candidatus Hodarchaeum mangrovi]
MHENGLCVYSKRFNEQKFEEQLLSGIISAVNSIMKNAFASISGGSIERIKYKEYNLIFKEKSPLLFCYVFKAYLTIQ